MVNKRINNKENKCIGDLKANFVRSTLRGQHHNKYSPLQITGNISLAWYRGRQLGKEETIKEIRSWVKKYCPEMLLSWDAKFRRN